MDFSAYGPKLKQLLSVPFFHVSSIFIRRITLLSIYATT